eukprot:2453481-Amphidinium_carterae.1
MEELHLTRQFRRTSLLLTCRSQQPFQLPTTPKKLWLTSTMKRCSPMLLHLKHTALPPGQRNKLSHRPFLQSARAQDHGFSQTRTCWTMMPRLTKVSKLTLLMSSLARSWFNDGTAFSTDKDTSGALM